MAKQIKRSDIAEENIFENVIKSANDALKVIDDLNKKLVDNSRILKENLQKSAVDSAKALETFNKQVEQAEKNQKDAIKLEQEREKLTQQKLRSEQELQKLQQQKINTQEKEARQNERLQKEEAKRVKTAQDQANAYKQLERNTRELKNQSKTLSAEMLNLERSGQKNTKQYKELEKQYRAVTRSAQEGDKALKKIDATVGDNFRNVGNYQSALGGLKNVLGQLGLAFGIGQVVSSVGTRLVEFNQSVADLSAITGATGKDLDFFKNKATELGLQVKGGATAVVEAYKLIGSAKPELLSNVEALNQVTESAIKLSQASGMELPESATALTDAMNQFGASADQASRFINVLAAGSKFGSAEVPQVTEALLKFGAVAKSANVNVEESTALIEALAERGLKGAEAGTALRNVMLKLSAPDALPKEARKRLDALGISFADISDKSKPFSERLEALKPLLNDNGALVKVFGTENAVAGRNLIESSARVKELNDQVTNTNTAYEQAAITTNTLGFSFNALKESFFGAFTQMSNGTGATQNLIDLMNGLAKNMSVIISTVLNLVELWVRYKAIVIASSLANKALNSSFMDGIKAGGLFKGTINGIKDTVLKLGQAIKANIAGIALSVITEIVATYQNLKSIYGTIAENANELSDASKNVEANLKKEKIEVDALFQALKKTNAGTVERQQLIDKINSTYGTTLTNLSDEAKFTKQVDQQYKSLISTLEKRAKLEGARVRFEASQRQLAEAEMAFRRAEDALYAFKTANVGEQLFGNIFEYFGATGETELRNILQATGEVLMSAKDSAKQYEAEYIKLQATVGTTTNTINGANQNLTTYNGTVNQSTGNVNKLNTELQKTNEYLSKQNELLAQIDAINYENSIQAKEQEIKTKLSQDVAYAKQTGEVQTEALEKLIADKYQIEIDAENKRLEWALKLKEYEYAEQSKKELEALKESRDAKIKEAKGDKKALGEIEANYQKELAVIAENDKKRAKDLESEKIIINEDSKDKIVEIEERKNDEINQANDELIAGQEEYAQQQVDNAQMTSDKITDIEKERYQTIQEFAKQTADYFIQQSERKIEQIQKEIDSAEKQYDYFKELAQQGNIDAEQSLAEQQRIIAEANKRKEQELKRQQRIRLAESVFSSYTANLEAGEKNALGKTISDVTLLTQFINSLPAFEKGTEDTGLNGKGVDGKGGFHAILHPNERVMTKEQNRMVGDLSNDELARIARDYQTGNLINYGKNQNVGLFTSEQIVSAIKNLESTVKSKPETNIELGEITQSIFEVVKTTKKGNQTTYNRFKVRK